MPPEANLRSSSPELKGPLTFVGFGFGPIQAGLFVLEAQRSGNFGRIVIAEVLPEVVKSVRENGGEFHLNVAREDGIESIVLGPIEMYDPSDDHDRERLVSAVAGASEIATAVPSVRFYKSGSPGSIHRILATGLERSGGKPAIVYAAENHNHAAEILEDAVLSEIMPGARGRVRASTRFLDTVIGKMSAVISDPGRIVKTGLRTITSRDPRAFLVEAFNRILISAVRFPEETPFRRGIEVFEEKPDLLPFEEAKLHGHNAAHALAAYLAAMRSLERLEELQKVPGAIDLVRRAFLEEAGEALIRKWKAADPFFSPAGIHAYVEDLMARIFNPYLGDLVERVARDPARKLGWDDRLVGTIRLCMSQGITPNRFALGAAAALRFHERDALGEGSSPAAILDRIWRPSTPDPAERKEVLRLIEEAIDELMFNPDFTKL